MNVQTINALKDMHLEYEINKDLYVDNLPVRPRRLAAYRDRKEGNLYEIREGIFTGIRGIMKENISALKPTETFIEACEFSINENSHGYVTVCTRPEWYKEATQREVVGYYVWFNYECKYNNFSEYTDAKYFEEREFSSLNG